MTKKNQDEKSVITVRLMKQAGWSFFATILLCVMFNTNKCGTGLYWQSLATILGIISCSAAVGILTGAVLGFPKVSKNLTESMDESNGYQNNTNMEQISDWVTKLVIGASLANLKDISDVVLHFAKGFGNSETEQYFGVAMIVFSFIVAMVITYPYVAYRLTDVLNKRLQEAEKELKEAEKEREIAIKERNNFERQSSSIKKKYGQAIKTIDQYTDEVADNTDVLDEAIDIKDVIQQKQNLPQQLNVNDGHEEKKNREDDYVIKTIANAIKPSSYGFDDDPWLKEFKDIHEDKKADVRISAKVEGDENDDTCDVTIRIEGSGLVEGSLVVIFLHPTFYRYKRFIRVKNGVVELTIASAGSFTVGVLANSGTVKLGYDLSKIEGAPKWFRES
jgi:hypothetical protein